MAFPSSPVDGQVYKKWFYNSTIGAWRKRSDGDVGDIKPRASVNGKPGWLDCDASTIGDDGSGATYTGEEYRDLFDEIKSSWGNAGTEDFDSGDTVALPDMRGESLRGTGTHGSEADAAGNNYAGPSVGSYQADQMQQITGSLQAKDTGANDMGAFGGGSGAFTTSGSGTGPSSGGGGINDIAGFDSADSPNARTGTETRMANAGVLFVIRM